MSKKNKDTSVTDPFAAPKAEKKTRTPVALEPEMQALVDAAKAEQAAAKNKVKQIKRVNKAVAVLKKLDTEAQRQVFNWLGATINAATAPVTETQS